MAESGHEVKSPQTKKTKKQKKNLQQVPDVMLLSGNSKKQQQKCVHLKSGNFRLDFLDSEDLQDEGVVSVM